MYLLENFNVQLIKHTCFTVQTSVIQIQYVLLYYVQRVLCLYF